MKVFGIGLSKTGTTSLASALEILGYRVKDNLGCTRYARGDLSTIDAGTLEENDAFTDTPIPSFYQELDRAYPGSKFILTVRDMAGWLTSCRKQFNARQAPKQTEAHNRLFFDLYQTTVFEESKFRNGYLRFVNQAIEYFRERPQDLLTLDVAGGDGWEKLCPFLGKTVPEVLFPKANVTSVTWLDLKQIVAIARDAGQELLRQREMIHFNLESLVRPDRSAVQRVRAAAGKVKYVAYRSERDKLDAITRTINRMIAKRLTMLNREIPILYENADLLSSAERHRWHHFWVVNGLDGRKPYIQNANAFTVNIALIQDGKPFLGVVYAPADGTLYYARNSLGGFKEVRGGEPSPLAAADSDDLPSTGSSASRQSLPAADARTDPAETSVALAMCAIAEVKTAQGFFVNGTTQWETAAAHAVINSTGRIVVENEGGLELRYNKPGLTNRSFHIE